MIRPVESQTGAGGSSNGADGGGELLAGWKTGSQGVDEEMTGEEDRPSPVASSVGCCWEW